MKRRQFMSNTLVAGLGSISLAACGITKGQTGEKDSGYAFSFANRDSRLLKLQERYRSDLYGFRQRQDSEIVALADRCVTAIMKQHLNPEFGLPNEALAHDLSPLKRIISRGEKLSGIFS